MFFTTTLPVHVSFFIYLSIGGRFFSEFDEQLHVVQPFAIPASWTRYFAMDYGMDMLAGYWIAMD